MKLHYFILVWILSCIIFPFWLIFNNFKLSLVFYLFLLVYLGIGIYLLYRWFGSKTTKNVDFIKPDKYLILVLILAFLSQIFALFFPLTSRGDEFYHILRGMNIFQSLYNILGNYTFIFAWLFLLLIILAIKFRDKLDECYENIKNKLGIKVLIIISVIIALVYFFLITKFSSGLLAQTTGEITNHLQWLIRYSPLPAIIYGFELSLLGYQEFGLRLASLVFYLLSGYFLYKLVALYRDERTAIFAATLLLFFPAFFHYGHTALITSGLVALMLASSYYFFKYIKENNVNDGLVTFLLLSLAFLYKNPALALYPIFWLIILSKNFKDISKFKFKKLYEPLKLTIISLIPVLPWLFISKLYVQRTYEFAIPDIINYLRLLPKQLTWVLAILFFASLVYSLFKQDELTMYGLSLFAVFYLVFSFEIAGASRLVIPYMAAIAILISQFIGSINKKHITCLIILVSAYLLVTSLVLTYIDYDNRLLPINKASKYVANNIPEDEKILASIPGIPYKFYANKYQDNFDRYIVKINQKNIKDLYQYMKDNKISYILLPTEGVMPLNEYGFTDLWWGNNYIEKSLVDDMLEENPYFEVENVFISGQNKMVLWKAI